MCSKCMRAIRKDLTCPSCFVTIHAYQWGRRKVFLHPVSPCPVSEAGNWFCKGKAWPVIARGGTRPYHMADLTAPRDGPIT